MNATDLEKIYLEIVEIKKKLEKIEESIEWQKVEIQKINTHLGNNEKHHEKLSNHIDFVEGVYDSIKTPFHYVADKITTTLRLEN
jgi:chromosome segregation ATPase